MTINTWQQIASTYKANLDASIPSKWRIDPSTIPNNCSQLVSTCGLLSDVELEIVKLDATALAEAIAARKYSSVQVTTAYLKAAAVAHQALNCLTDFFPEEALERAAWLDAELERTGKVVGPFHGVPISIKDHLGIKGHEVTAGFASWVGKMIPEKDGVYVGILRAAGAVFYVKTTNPQAIMHLECDSFLGATVNSYGRHLTSGGSSGGEGALLGIGGSAIGVGTDIGGSIRNPAAINGVYGFKPTSIRLPKGGNFSALGGQESIAGAIGPMARSARDMSLMYATILAAEPWKLDPVSIAMPYRPSEVQWKGTNGKPRVGVMWHDGVVLPQPPMRRALRQAVDKLKQAGWEVVDVEPFKSAEAWDLTSSLFFTDGGARIKAAMQATGEPMKPLTEWILSFDDRHRTGLEICEIVQRRDKFRADHLAHFYAYNVDIILSPSGPGPAPVLGTSKYWNYTSFWNLVDFPAGVLPSGEYVEETDVADAERVYMSVDDERIGKEYSPETFMGAPLPLQVAAVRWEDEKVLAAIELIDAVLKA